MVLLAEVGPHESASNTSAMAPAAAYDKWFPVPGLKNNDSCHQPFIFPAKDAQRLKTGL